jgi:hypothetical protein
MARGFGYAQAKLADLIWLGAGIVCGFLRPGCCAAAVKR